MPDHSASARSPGRMDRGPSHIYSSLSFPPAPYVCMHMHAQARVSECGGQRLTSGAFFNCSSLSFCEAGSLTGLVSWPAGQLRNQPVFICTVLGLQTHTTNQAFMWVLDIKVRSCACTANTLSTDHLSSQLPTLSSIHWRELGANKVES